MLIAFKLYGDYGKWKRIQKNNPQIKGKPLRAGMKLTYEAPSEKFDWSPQGLPHLIKRGDTLGKISKVKYGTSKKWKTIWDNNKPDGTPRKKLDNTNIYNLGWKPITDLDQGIKKTIASFKKDFI